MGLSWTDRLEDVSAQEWDSVLVRSFRPSPFLSRHFLIPWAKTFAAGHPKRIYRWERNGETCGLLFLCLCESTKGWELLGGEQVSDSLDAVVVSGRETEFWSEFLPSSRDFLSSGPLLLRRVPPAPGEEGAARTAQEDAEGGGNDVGIVLPRDPDKGGVRSGFPVVSRPSSEKPPGQGGFHGRKDGRVLPRGGRRVPVRPTAASRVPCRRRGGCGVRFPDRVERRPPPVQFRLRPEIPRSKPRNGASGALHRGRDPERRPGIRLPPGEGTVQVRPRGEGTDRVQGDRPRFVKHVLFSYHTCPLEEPGTGLAGGMNIFLRGLLPGLARHGIETDVLTRGKGDAVEITRPYPGVRVVHIPCGWEEP